MEKSSRSCVLSLLLGTLSLLLSVLAIAVCSGAFQAKQPIGSDAVAVSGTPSDAAPSDDRSEPEDEPSDEDVPEQQEASAPTPATPTYTVRLVPTSQGEPPQIGIYDSVGALLRRQAVPLATLSDDDQAALRSGIGAENFDRALRLIHDFCG